MNISEIIYDTLLPIMAYALIFSIPAASLIWLIISVIRYRKVPKSNEELRKKRRIPIIVSAIIVAVTIFVILAAFTLFIITLIYVGAV